jgi:TM2 domain-containing membrane protein YozV
MPNAVEPTPAPPYPRSPLAGFLSYLVPGLGQIYQGRVGKGVLFMVCLYGMFFYGMCLGSWSNVYLPDTVDQSPPPVHVPRPLGNLYNHLQFAGQFWIGIAAWPAIWQYDMYEPREEKGPIFGNFERTPYESRALPGAEPSTYKHEAPADWKGATLNELQTNGDKTWDLGWVYTVIAGVLNILVIYDAFAGPAFAEGEKQQQPQQQAVAA